MGSLVPCLERDCYRRAGSGGPPEKTLARSEKRLLNSYCWLHAPKAAPRWQRRKKGAGQPLPPDWAQRRKAIILRDRGRCQKCGEAGAREVDHIEARSDNGSDRLDNLRLLCRSCHARRTAYQGRAKQGYVIPEEWK